MLRVAVLASGNGTNFQALQDACATGYADAEIVCVLTDQPEAPVLERATRAGVEGVYVERPKGITRDDYDQRLIAELEARGVELACNAGFMRILGKRFCEIFEGRALNVHPSLLPAFPGAHAIRDAYEWGVAVTGVTIHFVTEDLDMGPIVLQQPVPVEPGDSLDSLEAKVHLAEYATYPKALRLFAEGALRLAGRRVVIERGVPEPPWAGSLPPGLS